MARIKKIKIKGFTIIDNDVINDDRMHLKALGLFAYMWSKPDDWQFYVSEIASHFKDGESAVSSAMKELMTLGYLKRTQNRKDGRFSNYDYVLRELPKRENQGSAPKGDFTKPEKPIPKKTKPENQGLLNTDHTNTDHINKDDDDQPVEDAFNLAQLAGINVNSGLNLPVFTDYINRLGNELVCYAIKRTNDVAQHPSWSYLKTVLKSLEDNHVKTVKQAEKLSKKYGQNRKSGKSSPRKTGKKPQYHFETRKAPEGMSRDEFFAKELAEIEAEDKAKENGDDN